MVALLFMIGKGQEKLKVIIKTHLGIAGNQRIIGNDIAFWHFIEQLTSRGYITAFTIIQQKQTWFKRTFDHVSKLAKDRRTRFDR